MPTDIISDLLPDLAYELSDSDEKVVGRMAETNAIEYDFEDWVVHSAHYYTTAQIPFRATLTIKGKQRENAMYCGTTIDIVVRGRARKDGSDWYVEEHEVISAEITDF